ncbi:MAG: hypothetical protein WC389_01520 [Lutibacter sp.]|jgi:hypothetical protein
MKPFNLDTSYTAYSNYEVFLLIKGILSKKFNEFETSYIRLLSISHLMLYITNDSLLNSTIRLLKECDLLNSEKDFEKPLYNILSNVIYNEQDCTRIRAFTYSSMFEYELKIKAHKGLYIKNLPKLDLSVNSRNFKNNINEIDKLLKKESINYVANEVTGKLENIKQKEEFKKLIESMDNVDYQNDTKFFKKDIKHLKILKDNILSNENGIEKNIKHHFYCQIGALFAQGFIFMESKNNYMYKNKSFTDITALTKYIQNDVLQNKKSVRQYIQNTINGNGIKNFYKSKIMMGKIINYCNENNLKVTHTFQDKFNKINDLYNI